MGNFCIYLVLRSLNFDLKELVLNLFYLETRMFNTAYITNAHTLSD
jgi:hypothetical protein